MWFTVLSKPTVHELVKSQVVGYCIVLISFLMYIE